MGYVVLAHYVYVAAVEGPDTPQPHYDVSPCVGYDDYGRW